MAMTLYRVIDPSKPWTGSGSFWSDDPETAMDYADHKRTRLVSIQRRGGVLQVDNDEELIEVFQRMGIRDAETRVYDADWFDADVYQAVRAAGFQWIERPIDLEVSGAREWIYVGAKQLR